MILRTLSASLVIVATVACSSPEKDAYRRLASEANPPLTAIKPVVEKILALKLDERTAIIELCMAADEPLRTLGKINFYAEYVAPEEQHWSVSSYAKDLLNSRSFICDLEDGVPDRTERCSNWCFKTWTELVKAAGRLRLAAKEVGVEIVPLRP